MNTLYLKQIVRTAIETLSAVLRKRRTLDSAFGQDICQESGEVGYN